MSAMSSAEFSEYCRLMLNGSEKLACGMLLDRFYTRKAQFDALANVQHANVPVLSPRPKPLALITSPQRLMDIAAAQAEFEPVITIIHHANVEVQSPRPIIKPLITDAQLLMDIVQEREEVEASGIKNVRSVSPMVFSSPRPVHRIDLELWEDSILQLSPEPELESEPDLAALSDKLRSPVPGLDLSFLSDDEDSDFDFNFGSDFECDEPEESDPETDLDDDEDTPFEQTLTYKKLSAQLTWMVDDDED